MTLPLSHCTVHTWQKELGRRAFSRCTTHSITNVRNQIVVFATKIVVFATILLVANTTFFYVFFRKMYSAVLKRDCEHHHSTVFLWGEKMSHMLSKSECGFSSNDNIHFRQKQFRWEFC